MMKMQPISTSSLSKQCSSTSSDPRPVTSLSTSSKKKDAASSPSKAALTTIQLTQQDVKLLHSTSPGHLQQLPLSDIEVLYQSAVKYTEQQALLAEEQRLKKVGIKPSRILAQKLEKIHKEMSKKDFMSTEGGTVRDIIEGRPRSPSPARAPGPPALADVEREEQLQRESIVLYAARVFRQLKWR